MMRTILGRDAEGLVIDIDIEGEGPIGGDNGGVHPNLAAHTTLGLAATHAHPYAADPHDHDGTYEPADAVATHEAAANPHPTYLTAAEGDAAYSATDHTHAGGSEAFPVGSVFLSVVTTNPSSLLGYGTWTAFGAGRMLLGFANGDTDEATGGAATHTHAGHTDHAALTHAGATVGNHAVTQPGAHTDHAALAHSAHAGATVANHTDVLNHVHTENINTATTGGLVGFPALQDTSTSGSTATGLVTSNPTANGVAAQVHTVGQATAHTDHAAQSHSAHSGTAVDAHAVGQANQHAAQSHSAHDSTSNLPPFVTVHMWKRTA